MNGYRLPDHLIQSIDSGKCVLFLGAGVSTAAGLPNAADLTRLLADRCYYPKTYAQDLLDVAEYYQELRGRADLIATLRRALQSQQVTSLHRRIAVLARKFRFIITTNYDTLLERALDALGEKYHRIATEKDLPGQVANEISLIKLHGDFAAPEIVLTRDDYQRNMALAFDSPLASTLKAVLASGTILFVGYSLRDYNFVTIYNSVRAKLGELSPHNYAAVLRPEPIERTVWKKRGVELLDIDADRLFASIQESLSPNDRIRVFLSHSFQDISVAELIRDYLEKSGLEVFSPQRDIEPGSRISEVISDQLLRCNRYVALISRASASSAWTKMELERAVSLRHDWIVPVLLEDCEIPTELTDIKYIDARRTSTNELASSIKDAIEAHWRKG